MLGPLECVCYIWQLGAENHPSSFLFHFSPLSYLSRLVCVILSLPLTLLFTAGIQVFGFGVLLAVLRGARCTFVLLSGPVWALGGGDHQPKEPGQFYCPAAFQSKKPTVRRVFGRGWGGHGWGSGSNVAADCHRSSPALSRSVLPPQEPRGRQMHLPEIHTPGPDAYPPPPRPPSSRFYRNAACATHRCPFTLL